MARRKDHTREELEALIIDSARALVVEGGIEALTARNVARCTGYVPGTIYNLFPSMDGLVLHVNAWTLDRMYEFLSEVRPAHKNPRKNLALLASAYRAFIRDNRSLWLLLFSDRLPEERHQLPWYQERIDRLFGLIEAMFARMAPGGRKRTLSLSARTLWASFHGLCFLEESGHLSTIGKDKAGIDAMTDCLIDHFVGSLTDKS